MSKNALNLKKWIESTANRAASMVATGEIDLSARDFPQDESLPILQTLQEMGYDTVIWNSESSTHASCAELNGQTWAINDFVSGLTHNAPMFERSHPGDRSCFVIVTGPDEIGLGPVQVGPWPYQ